MLNKLKKNNKKGFTLVELIVVLVILAILAALLVPALTKYIDKAKTKQIIAQTRQAVMAAQTLADEGYGKTPVDYSKVTSDEIKALADLPTGITITITPADDIDTDGTIKKLVLSDGTRTCTYEETPTDASKAESGHYTIS